MKKTTKILFSVLLCAVMLVMSVLPAFADTVLIEDHSVVDCTHYYKENGNYYFQIKCPEGQLDKVTVGLSGPRGGAATVSFKYTSFTGIFGKEYAYSHDGYEYTWLIVKCSEWPDAYESRWGGMIAKVYYFDGENSKMATNTSNGSTVAGPGYKLS
ncbi:MAG: hypothetical protein K2M82_02210 [Lachnospiraceae bacterium]|nr:hypothetical protein [Lachnospiraceae bacterium]